MTTKMIAWHPVKGHLSRTDPEWPAFAKEISGELRRVRMWNEQDRNGHFHEAVDYVPIEDLDNYVAKAQSNANRNVEAGDRAWDHVEVGTEHDAGPGGEDQHEVDAATVRRVHAAKKG